MAIDGETFSRPARLAANLAARTEEECAHLFLKKSVLIRLESAFAHIQDARETFLFALNQVLRFCPNVSLLVPPEYQDLADRSIELAFAIHGAGRWIQIIGSDREVAAFDAIINVGTTVANDLPWITVNSSGWLGRVASARSGVNELPWSSASANACGALAAACLGVGAAFLTILGQPPNISQEISLFTHQVADLGVLHEGPALPSDPLEIDAFLVGCGAVTNGWAYTIKRLPIVGTLQAIDRQSLRIENLGPYVLATRAQVKTPKAQIIAEFLAPTVAVTPRPEEWELFKIRLNYGIAVPALIINGLDHVGTRHSVQRLWPETLVDMAAGGLTTQVIVKPAATDALCLLRALDIPPGELEWAERLALETGLSVERIRSQPVTEITKDDVDAAGPAHRAQLEKSQGKLICGRVTEQNLTMEATTPDFAPAVPFVTAFSGVVGAAETLKRLMGVSSGLHYQRHFQSNRSRALQMVCDSECECQEVRSVNKPGTVAD
jgi:hypothetical protein